jgi:lysophospholipase L1-like esterase
LLGEWVQQGNPCVGEDSATTFHSQSTYVLPVAGQKGRFIFMADRWNKTDLEKSGYLWLPLSVEDGRVQIRDTGAMDRRFEIGGLALLYYNLRARPEAGVEAYSFVRFYTAGDSLLLEYREPVKDGYSGNYTETPPDTRYLVLGTRGALSSDSLSVELHPGEKETPSAPQCDLREYLRPLWASDTIHNETVLLFSESGGPAGGRLLYQPDRVLSVRNYGLDTMYREGKDFEVHGNRIVRRGGSQMPFRADSSFDSRKNLAWYILQSQWVVVSYTHHDKWPGPVPLYSGDRLPRLMERLRSGRPVTIVAYGMSITRGMDVSGYDRVAPHMPTYMQLFARGVQEHYPKSSIRMYNAGLPGSTVDWGAKYADQYVNPLHPDLVVLDFGMNDFWRMRPEEFGDSIRTIMRKVRAANPGVEFLLLSNMKFDPGYVLDSDTTKGFYTGNLAGYHEQLRVLEGPGVVGLNMTGISEVLYQRKKAKDCIANPLHPNDYMARWYAQGMIALICP